MKRTILMIVQILAGFVLWFWMVVFWKRWLPFYTEYGTDASRIEAKGITVVVLLLTLAQYATYWLRRGVSRQAITHVRRTQR